MSELNHHGNETSAENSFASKLWKPTKFLRHGGRWRSSSRHVGIHSRLSTELMLAQYENALNEFASGDLTDLGCGNAPLAGIYLPLVKSTTWVDWGESRYREIELDYEIDLNEQLPFGDSSYDTVIMSDVLEHIAEPDILFSEISRILRKGGHVIIGVPFMYWIHEEPHDHFRYTRFALKRFGEKHGLRVVRIDETGGGLDVIGDVACKLVAAKARPLAYLIYYVFKALRNVLGLRSLNAQAMRKMPLGYLAIYEK